MRGTAVAASWSSFLLLLFFTPLSLRQKEKTTKLFHTNSPENPPTSPSLERGEIYRKIRQFYDFL